MSLYKKYVFVKKNGEIRKMIATTDYEWVKANQNKDWYEPRGTGYDKTNLTHLITVWDVEKRAFRNIVLSSITEETDLTLEEFQDLLKST